MKRHVPSCDGADDHPIQVYRSIRGNDRSVVIRQGEDLIVFEADQVPELALALLETVRELEEGVRCPH